MLQNFRLFSAYAKQFGWSNATFFALFKLFPRKFALLAQKLGAGKTSVSPLVAALDYRTSFDTVFDYAPWTQFGGSASPARSKSGEPTYVWFVPDWLNVWGGGHFTLFRFAQHFAKKGTKNIIYIYDNRRHSNPKALQAELDGAFKDCLLEVVTNPKDLPAAHVAIATTWQSAYHVRAFANAKHKFYFMQDYESQFYAHGTASMQANATYAFGFHGITGGGWLRGRYEAHGGTAQNYRFAADKDIFYPAEPSAAVREQVKRIFFYGRPSTERRCFELGIVALKKIADAFPDVEIIVGGLDLAQSPPFKATLLGNMTLAQTGDLYRTCDVGIAFSGTNLSYLPVELMQSGVPVISNNGAHVEWFCENEQNALLVDPTPQAVLDAFTRLHNDKALRQRLATNGRSTTAPTTWEGEMDKIFHYVQTNAPSVSSDKS